MKRGVLGGTFNPVHNGHVMVAEEARSRLGLTEVILVPAGEPWMKQDDELAPTEHRWEMVLRATAHDPALVASRVDIERPGPSYAIDTMGDLMKEFPDTSDYRFIMGMDALLSLPMWKEPTKMLGLFRVAVVTRPHVDMEKAVAAVSRELPGVMERIDFLEGLKIDISSTDIRRRCKEGSSIGGLVPKEVEAYIQEHGLYE